MAGGFASAKQVLIRERQQFAVALRRQGLSYRAIAKAVASEAKFKMPNYSLGAAHKDVTLCLRELIEKTQHTTEELRQLELERLDQAQAAISKKVQLGSLEAIDRWLKISDHRAKLLGLYAPVQMKIEEGVEAELENFLQSLEALLDRETFVKVLQAVTAIQGRAEAAGRN